MEEMLDLELSLLKIFKHIGENPDREGLRKTPERIIKSWQELYSGYNQNPAEVFTTFDEQELLSDDGIILLKNIDFFSTCEHHMLPFMGKASIAYIPRDKIVGISKLARLLEVYTRRMQIQERIGHQVTTSLMEYLNAKGAACIIDANHLCMAARGVNKKQANLRTCSYKGLFQEDKSIRNELLTLLTP